MKEWFYKMRVPIGYGIGVINLLVGILNCIIGNVSVGLLWLVIGSYLIFDVKTYK
jgi:hypothetical protein